MDRNAATWFAIAGLAAFWALSILGAGGGAFLPGVLCALALGCAMNSGLHKHVMAWGIRSFSGSSARTAMILIGAMMLWQLVGVELALLLAGDILAYLEVVAAVSLIAANVRLRPVKAAVMSSLVAVPGLLGRRRRAMVRAVRSLRSARHRPPRADDEGEAGWAYA